MSMKLFMRLSLLKTNFHSGAIAHAKTIAARAAVKDRRPPPGGERVRALVLDCEHAVIGLLRWQSGPGLDSGKRSAQAASAAGGDRDRARRAETRSGSGHRPKSPVGAVMAPSRPEGSANSQSPVEATAAAARPHPRDLQSFNERRFDLDDPLIVEVSDAIRTHLPGHDSKRTRAVIPSWMTIENQLPQKT